jgi:aldose 1-epimerase
MPLTIGDGSIGARVAPELGGMVLAFWSTRGPDVLHWFWPLPDEELSRTAMPKGGLFVLAPFSNRIPAGAIDWRGRRHALAPHPEVAPEALHGYANRLPFVVASQEQDRVHLVLDGLGAAWPWRLRVEQTIAIEDSGLAMSLALVSEDAEPQPVGLGFHPFFLRTGGQTLTLAAADRYDTDPLTRPTLRHATGATAEHPLEVGLDPLTIGRFLGDWDGRARLSFPSLGAALLIEADPAVLPYVLLFCPPDRPFVCAEPVSHLTGAFELDEGAAAAQGLRVLEPGARLEARLRLVPVLRT